MQTPKVRKNFLLEKDLIDKAQKILLKHHNSLTEAISLYLKAIVKDPDMLKHIEKSAHRRTGRFIGMLDGKIGDKVYRSVYPIQHTKRVLS